MADQSLKRSRTISKSLFTRSANSLRKTLDEHSDIDVIKERFKILKLRWNNAQDCHENYVQSIPEESIDEGEDNWILELQDIFENLEVM